MNPAEIEFLAEKEIIRIVPKFEQATLHLISGDVGPFTAGMPVKVPLWMAVNLKKRQKCRIVPPEWLTVEVLQEKKQAELDSKFFTPMPNPFYMELSQVLLDCASDDIPRGDSVRTLIKDIWDLRMAKLRTSIDTFVKSDATHAKLNHLTVMEINCVRPFLTGALDVMHELRTNLTLAPPATQD